MADDEELILKGSPLYCYLQEKGFSNFECYESNQQSAKWIQPSIETKETLPVVRNAPQWAMDHLHCILKSGLILEDHRYFIECICPHQPMKTNSSLLKKCLMSSAPLLCIIGGVWGVFKSSNNKGMLVGVVGLGSICIALCTKDLLRTYWHSCALNQLGLTLMSLEKLFLQFKRMLRLVQQNDLIPQNLSLRHQEIQELKQIIKVSLCSANHKFTKLLDELKDVPLSIHVDPALQSQSEIGSSYTSALDQEDVCSFDSLKKLFNSYILLQSEFLRRLALSFCTEFWSNLTPGAILKYTQKHFPAIEDWSLALQQSLSQNQKFFRSLIESKDKERHLKRVVTPGWDFSDLYLSIRCASAYLQSIEIETLNLQDILEKQDCEKHKNNHDFLQSIAQILTQITMEIRSSQLCFDTSLVQVYKMLNILQPTDKLNNHGVENPIEKDLDNCSDSSFNAIIQDEVFELTVPLEEFPASSDEDIWDELSFDYSKKKNKEGESSKIVLQELKSVLVKKADEWRERERRAMEMKGITYTAPEQVITLVKEENVSDESDLPSGESCQSDWPLPRLKAGIRTHRWKGTSKNLEVNPEKTDLRPPSSYQSKYEDVKGLANEILPTRVGFGASLLAEAMAKSKTMQLVSKEDVFHDADDGD